MFTLGYGSRIDLEDSESEESLGTGAQSERGHVRSEYQERSHVRIPHALSTAAFPAPVHRPSPRESQHGRTTTLLITSEFERPMVLSYKGMDASLLEPELSTPLRIPAPRTARGAESQRSTPQRRKDFESLRRRRQELAASVAEEAEKQRHEPVRERSGKAAGREAGMPGKEEARKSVDAVGRVCV